MTLTIDEAIRSNQLVYTSLRSQDRIALAKAVGLGIEALKCLAVYRNRHPQLIWELLPGETED